ncbi:protein-tyrosine-phosphatase MKP1 [Canna indica]|uniref:Protein-tyrosine-phosphatase MKP1 n=1 Tax=Canna indica TaxID=4628 RepID=A0AAQ3Q7P7_9LILI|nr:protein-tyrosine-phosphatase MKP1 [Canna indica]
MLGGEEDSAAGQLPGGRRIWRSASWSASRTAATDHSRDCVSEEKNASNGQFKQRPAPPLTPRSQSQKARSCLPPLQPLAIARRSLDEWPKAGSDDIGEWPQPSTPGAKSEAHRLGDSLKLDLSSLRSQGNRDQIAFFDKECSKVADHIYLGGDYVARNREILRQHGITHVLNCVGFVCPEYFKSDLVYKTLWLQDSPTEDITSILYDVFDYFEDVRQEGGRVFVHCCQGVSRSTSLVIAYLMWREGQSFDDAFQFVKAARRIANPNMGFACQLLQCQKRVHAIPLSPNSVLRMYRMAPHSPYDPLHLVPKMLNDPSPAALDSRGAFIIHVLSSIYVWIGKNCESVMEKDAKAAAFQVVRYERVEGPTAIIGEGEEPLDFWEKFLNALPSDDSAKTEKVQFESAAKISIGKRRVEAYDVDFELFYKALAGGIVPPFSSSGHDCETRLPARESNWSVLRRKFPRPDMLRILSGDISSSPPYPSPHSLSSDSSTSSKSSSESPSVSPSTCSSPSLVLSPAAHNIPDPLLQSARPSLQVTTNIESSNSSFRKICSPPKGLPQSIAERRGSFSTLKLSTLCKDASLTSNKVLNASSEYQSAHTVLDKKSIDKTSNTDALGCKNSIALDSDVKCMGECAINSSKDSGNTKGLQQDDQFLRVSTRLDVRSKIPSPKPPLVYRWPSMEKLTTLSIEDFDSRAVFLFLTSSISGNREADSSVLHLWIGSEFEHVNGQTQLSIGDRQIVSIDWQKVGCDFLDSVGLPKNLPVKVLKEDEKVKLLELVNST